MSTQAPTPESDREKFACNYTNPNGSFFGDCVELGFARNLERERDEARAELEEWKARSQKNICELVNIHAAQAAQIVQLRSTLQFIRDECDWEESPIEGENGGDQRIGKACAAALSFPPPPVVPLEDVRPLVEALRHSYDATNWPADGSSMQEEALAAFTTKHPLP